jgi:hypothetical protein
MYENEFFEKIYCKITAEERTDDDSGALCGSPVHI